jgi:hypothetical protein
MSEVAALPLCAPADSAPVNTWRSESFEGVSLRLPRGFRTAAPCCFDHGGKAWTNGRVTVTLTKGYFGPTSFAAFGRACRVERRGNSALLIIDVQPRAASVSAWDPEIRAGGLGVVVNAAGPTAGDLPLLRSIVLSLAN